MIQTLTCRMEIAAEHGVDAAVFMHNITYWMLKNKAEEKHFYDGRYWACSSYKGLVRWFEPLWSAQQIKRLVVKCRDAGLLLIGNYNSDPHDHTNWYSPSDKIMEIYGCGDSGAEVVRNRPIERSISSESWSEFDQSNNVIINNKINTPIAPKEVLDAARKYVGEDRELADALYGLLENRFAMKKPVKTLRSLNGILRELDKLSEGDRATKIAMLHKATTSNWLTVYALKSDEVPQRPASGGREEFGWKN